MVALSGVGLLYVYASGPANWQSRSILLLAILPIAFIANIVRVTLLVLLTYHGGERIGHLFHDFAGYLEIALAFGAFFALDRLIKWIWTGGAGPSLRTTTMIAS
jgi:exosortase/archaeosortase family protein